jgi:VanZ family protein
LSYLLYNALSRDVQGIRAWFLALLLATLVGLGDEALQLFVPGRFASLKDILVDLRGVAFGLMFAAIAEIEKKLLALGSGRMS